LQSYSIGGTGQLTAAGSVKRWFMVTRTKKKPQGSEKSRRLGDENVTKVCRYFNLPSIGGNVKIQIF
jgi:hypothetical protein